MSNTKSNENDNVQEAYQLPSDIAAAFHTGRPELIFKPKKLWIREECEGVSQLVKHLLQERQFLIEKIKAESIKNGHLTFKLGRIQRIIEDNDDDEEE